MSNEKEPHNVNWFMTGNGIKAFLFLVLLLFFQGLRAQDRLPHFKVLAFYENGGHHVAYSARAVKWLNQLAIDSNFTVDYRQSTDDFTDTFLAQYQLLIQLDFAPYGWKEPAKKAFIHYITTGKGGWIGFHHATLLGEFDGFPMWSWFSDFMGNIRYKDYIPDFAAGTVKVEDVAHPVMKGLPKSFRINREEWYSYQESPRPNVHVLAHVDESTYQPDTVKVRMGDHPVIWTNERVRARNVYIFMGHGPDLFDSEVYVQLFKNAIFWAVKR